MTIVRNRMTTSDNRALVNLIAAWRLGAEAVAIRLYRRCEYGRLAGLVRLLRAGRRVELGANEGQLIIEGEEAGWNELDGE